MSGAVTELADAAIWLEWRRQGRPGNPPQLTPSVAGQYDKAAKAMAQEATNGDVSEDELLESYGRATGREKSLGS